MLFKKRKKHAEHVKYKGIYVIKIIANLGFLAFFIYSIYRAALLLVAANPDKLKRLDAPLKEIFLQVLGVLVICLILNIVDVLRKHGFFD